MSDELQNGQQNSTEPEVTSTSDDSSTEETTTQGEEVTEGQQSEQQEQESSDGDESEESGVPEKYELSLPENSLLNDESLSKLSETAKELGLSNEQAQKLVESQNDAVSNYQQQAEQNWKQQIDSWSDAVKNDKEMGGDNFDQTITHAQAAIEKFAPPEFKDALNESGYGNHPELVRTFARIGKWIGEDNPVGAQSSNGGERRVADKLYGNNN